MNERFEADNDDDEDACGECGMSEEARRFFEWNARQPRWVDPETEALAQRGIVVHSSSRADWPSSYEYPLPVLEFDSRHEGVSAWAESLKGRSETEVLAMLAERWNGITQPAVRELRDQLLAYRPRSIVFHEGAAWLELLRPSGRTEPETARAYIPAPIDAESLRAKLIEAGYAADGILFEFLRHFGGVREDVRSDGDLASPDGSWWFMDEAEVPDNPPGFAEWNRSLRLYGALTGDAILVHPTLRTGWYVFPENKFREIARDFEGFLRYYVDYRASTDWPLDSYGPGDED